jgi:membrane fusion protein (multidrug efflux system)
MPVLVTGQDFPGKTIHGHVASIAPIATKSTDATSTAKQVLTTIQLDENPPYLRDGMSADVDILTTNIPRSIVVANDALFKEKGKSYVYVVTDGAVHKRAVVTGKAGESQTLVTSGLAAGDVIVSQKSPELTDGAKVKAMPSASPSTSPSSS